MLEAAGRRHSCRRCRSRLRTNGGRWAGDRTRSIVVRLDDGAPPSSLLLIHAGRCSGRVLQARIASVRCGRLVTPLARDGRCAGRTAGAAAAIVECFCHERSRRRRHMARQDPRTAHERSQRMRHATPPPATHAVHTIAALTGLRRPAAAASAARRCCRLSSNLRTAVKMAKKKNHTNQVGGQRIRWMDGARLTIRTPAQRDCGRAASELL